MESQGRSNAHREHLQQLTNENDSVEKKWEKVMALLLQLLKDQMT